MTKYPEFAEYLGSEFHNERVETAASLALERLTAIAKSGPDAAVSEIMGMTLGIARFQQKIQTRRQTQINKALGDPTFGRVEHDYTEPERSKHTRGPNIPLPAMTVSEINFKTKDQILLRELLDGRPHNRHSISIAIGVNPASTALDERMSRLRKQFAAAGILLGGTVQGRIQLSEAAVKAIKTLPWVTAP